MADPEQPRDLTREGPANPDNAVPPQGLTEAAAEAEDVAGAPRNLLREGAPESAAASATPTVEPPSGRLGEVPYDPSEDREKIRGQIALWLVYTLVGLVIIVALIGLSTAVICAIGGGCSEDTLDLRSIRTVVELILTPLVGLVGAVTGFYFGEKAGGQRQAGRNR